MTDHLDVMARSRWDDFNGEGAYDRYIEAVKNRRRKSEAIALLGLAASIRENGLSDAIIMVMNADRLRQSSVIDRVENRIAAALEAIAKEAKE